MTNIYTVRDNGTIPKLRFNGKDVKLSYIRENFKAGDSINIKTPRNWDSYSKSWVEKYFNGRFNLLVIWV